MRMRAFSLMLGVLLSVAGCGGGDRGSSFPGIASTPPPPPAANVAAVTVDAGPNGNSVNTLFTSITLCAPGSLTQCQTIDHIQVDTGSVGLRVLAPVLAPVLASTLPGVQATDGNALAECTKFVDGYSWGPLSLADVQIGGEKAASVPIQVIGAANFAAVPAPCAQTGIAEDTVAQFGANGILGIGVFQEDCGQACASSTAQGDYYSCAASGCVPIAVPLNSQVLNPVPLFAVDNNGTILELPSAPASGNTVLNGSLIFGVDTQGNNASGNEFGLVLDAAGQFTTQYGGIVLPQSFIDSGTNGIFFGDAQNPPIALCQDPNFKDFYCPASDQTYTALLYDTAAPGTAASVAFTVGNAQTLSTANPGFTVLPTLAGTYKGVTPTFDWGLPFYFGRRVITVIEKQRTAAGIGPYVAF